MVTNPDRDRVSKLDRLDDVIPPLPSEVLEFFSCWTPKGAELCLSDWQLVMLRVLWHRSGVSSSPAASITPRIYKPMIARVVGGTLTLATTQSISLYNKGEQDALLIVDGQTFTIEPRETHSWNPPGENLLCEVQVNAMSTSVVINYLEELAD